MSLSTILSVSISIVVAFVLGVVGALFLGTRTTLNYFLVKISRGKKVLLFIKTPFGWESTPAVKHNETLLWKYHKVDKVTTIQNEKDISRYSNVESAFTDLKQHTRTINLKDGELAPVDFDTETYNNILIRALTRPSTESLENMKRLLIMAVIGIVIILFIAVAVYFKQTEILQTIQTMNARAVI